VLCHPDDELAIAVTIRRLVQTGGSVHLAWTHRTDVREGEARNAARLIGVNEAHLTFFEGRDGDLVDDIPALRPRMDDLMRDLTPDQVVTVAFEQGHIDHDATNLLVNLSFQGPVFEYPMYHTYLTRMPVLNRFADPAAQQVTELTPEEMRFKVQLARTYPSQTIWRNVVWYERASLLKGRRIRLAATERLRRQTHRDFLTPNLPDRLRDRVTLSPHWQRWIAAMRRMGIGA